MATVNTVTITKYTFVVCYDFNLILTFFFFIILFRPTSYNRLHHDIARSITAKTGHYKLHGVPGSFAQRTTDAHAQFAARRRGRCCTVRPGKMAVRLTGQSGDHQWHDGLDKSVEILQAPAADRLLGGIHGYDIRF